MTSQRLYQILLLSILALLVGAGVLSVTFFHILGSDGDEDAQARAAAISPSGTGPSAQVRSDAPAPDGRPADVPAVTITDSHLIGMGGAERKFGLAGPSLPSIAGTNITVATALREAAAAVPGAPLIGGIPEPFMIDCEDYGGDFDMVVGGAGLNVFAGTGEACLDLLRPDLPMARDEKRTFTPNGGSFDACALDRQVVLCMKFPGAIGNAPFQSGGWAEGGSRGPAQSVSPEDRFWKWHMTAAYGRAASRDGDAVGGANGSQRVLRNNYYLGDDARQWFTDLPAFTKVEYRNVYPGIDLTCYADQSRFEYVFVLWPGAALDNLRFAFEGGGELQPDEKGNLTVHFECGKMVMREPLLYQIVDGQPRLLPARYAVRDRQVAFEAERYDASKPLFASPRLDFLSYLGGRADDKGWAVATDNNGFVYVAGETFSPTFSSRLPARRDLRTSSDVFVAKYRVTDGEPVYTTFIGGRGEDRPLDIATDAAGNVYVCGETLSGDFPSTNRIDGLAPGGGWDAFLVMLDSSGRVTNFAGRIGGAADDRTFGLALAPDGSVFMAGETLSPDFPPPKDLPGQPAGMDAFALRIENGLSRVAYATRLGGRADDSAFDIAVDAIGAAFLTGQTASDDFPVSPVTFQHEFQGGKTDAFVTKLTPDGSRVAYSTFLGGMNDDRGMSIRCDYAGNAYVAGDTASQNFPVTNAYQAAFAGGDWDAFVTKLMPDGAVPAYSTFLGGGGADHGYAVSPDASGKAYVAGATSSTNFYTFRPYQARHAGGQWDGFTAKFDSGGAPIHASYLGGQSNDFLTAIATDPAGAGHVAGTTASSDLSVLNALQSQSNGGTNDALLAQIPPEETHAPDMCLVPGSSGSGPEYDFYMSKYEITNDQYVRFLNDAQANTNDERGAHLYFDPQGSVWFNPGMQRERDEVFTVANSRLVYHAAYPVGARYAVSPRVSPQGGSYTNHPISGVSWYGAVKYCNWLTISSGRGVAERCYREGTNAVDWAPVGVTSTNWLRGDLGAEERIEWLKLKGFRLPMDNCATPVRDLGSWFRVANWEFTRFLNDADRNRGQLRNSNMVFDERGNVWLSPRMRPQADELFAIGGSHIVFDPIAPAGERYATSPAAPLIGGSYSNHPVSGVSWAGAMKYCNWLSLAKGRRPSELAYREGAAVLDWAPSTCTTDDWRTAEFQDDDIAAWRRLPGFRLPLDSKQSTGLWTRTTLDLFPATNSWINPFNEFLKAATWSGSTNISYGYGRNTRDARDANFLNSGAFDQHDTTPVGYYNGTAYGGELATRTNGNAYGIYDLSGNVTEWLSDVGKIGTLRDRACYGGSWMFELSPVTHRAYVSPYFTDRFRGFRVVSTASGDEMYVARMPYRLCLCGAGSGAGCGEGEKPGESAMEEEVGDQDIPVLEIPAGPKVPDGGVIYKPQPPNPPVPPIPPPPEPPRPPRPPPGRSPSGL